MMQAVKITFQTAAIEIAGLNDIPRCDFTIIDHRISIAPTGSVPATIKRYTTAGAEFTEIPIYYMTRSNGVLTKYVYQMIEVIHITTIKKGNVYNFPCRMSGAALVENIWLDQDPTLLDRTDVAAKVHRYSGDRESYERTISMIIHALLSSPHVLSDGTP